MIDDGLIVQVESNMPHSIISHPYQLAQLEKELLLRNVFYKISLLAKHSRSSISTVDGDFIDESQSTQHQRRDPPNKKNNNNNNNNNNNSRAEDLVHHRHDIQTHINSSNGDEMLITGHDGTINPEHGMLISGHDGTISPEHLPPSENKRNKLKRFANLGDVSRKYQLSTNTTDNFLGEGDAGSNLSMLDKDALSPNNNSMPNGIVAAVPPPFDKDKLRIKSIRDRRIVKGSSQPAMESIPDGGIPTTSAAQQHGLLPSVEQAKDGHRRKQTVLKLSKDDSKTELKLPPLVPPRARVPSSPLPTDSVKDNQDQSVSSKKRRPKKPLFMRMMDEAQRRYEEDEKLKVKWGHSLLCFGPSFMLIACSSFHSTRNTINSKSTRQSDPLGKRSKPT